MRRTFAAQDGMTVVELLVAAFLLVGGLAAGFLVLGGARDLTTVSERQDIASQRAEQALERLRAVRFADLALASAPGPAADADDPRSAVVGGTAYDWNPQGTTDTPEPLVVDPSGADAVPPRTSWDDGRYTGTLDVFVSEVDPRLKRLTVAVRLDAGPPPRKPVVLSTLVSQAAEAGP